MTFRDLVVQASRCTGISTAALYGPSQQRYLCAVRSAVYVAAKDTLGMGFAAIGRRMGRDHSTIINAIDKRDVYSKLYPQFNDLIEVLKSDSLLAHDFTNAFEPTRRLGWAKVHKSRNLGEAVSFGYEIHQDAV